MNSTAPSFVPQSTENSIGAGCSLTSSANATSSPVLSQAVGDGLQAASALTEDERETAIALAADQMLAAFARWDGSSGTFADAADYEKWARITVALIRGRNYRKETA